MNYKILTKDIELEWDLHATRPAFLEESFNIFNGTTYNVKIFDEKNILITEEKDIPITQENIQDLLWLTHFDSMEETPLEMMCSPPRQWKSFTSNKKVAKQIYIYNLEKNYSDFLQKNNAKGFFKKLKFIIECKDFINEVEVEYSNLNLDNATIENMFIDILKSSDNFGIKLILNSEKIKENNINGFYVVPYKYKNNQKIKLEQIFISDIDEKWLDNNQNIKILTLPINDLILDEEIIEIEIFYFTKGQIDFLNFFKTKMSNLQFNDFLIENFTNQLHKPGLIFKENSTNQIVGLYQGILYLLNNESYQKLGWPNTNISLLNTEFKKYFIESNKDELDYTLSIENEISVPDAIPIINTDTIELMMPDNLLGYYLKNNNNLIYKDLKSDLSYFKNTNINNISIIDVIENENKTSIYLECVTPFSKADEIYIETNTTNLIFMQKYFKEINSQKYVTFLLNYEYDNTLTREYLINNSINKDRLIQGKRNISFNIKLY
jgi:hypothetical protein